MTPSSRRASQRPRAARYGWVPSLHSLGAPGIAKSVQLHIASLSVSSKKSTCAQHSAKRQLRAFTAFLLQEQMQHWHRGETCQSTAPCLSLSMTGGPPIEQGTDSHGDFCRIGSVPRRSQ